MIADVIIRAYADVAYSDRREHLMVERLRQSDAFIPELSLVACFEDQAVGHILMTRAHIVSDRSAVTTLGLAPLSVVPSYQGLGVGKQLVRTAHKKAAQLGFQSIVLVGIPDYYTQFGYQRLSLYPVTLPFDAPDENCMIAPLVPGALDHVTGRVKYAEAWLDH